MILQENVSIGSGKSEKLGPVQTVLHCHGYNARGLQEIQVHQSTAASSELTVRKLFYGSTA